MLCELCKINEVEQRLQIPGSTGEQTVWVCSDCYNNYMSDFYNNSKRCAYCGRTFFDIRQTGIVGCAGCYEQFQSQLREYIRKVQRL